MNIAILFTAHKLSKICKMICYSVNLCMSMCMCMCMRERMMYERYFLMLSSDIVYKHLCPT